MKTVEDRVRYLVWEHCSDRVYDQTYRQVLNQVRNQVSDRVGRGFSRVVFLDLVVDQTQ